MRLMKPPTAPQAPKTLAPVIPDPNMNTVQKVERCGLLEPLSTPVYYWADPPKHKHTKESWTVSPSMLSTYMDCPRKFFLTYIIGPRPPGTVSNMIGSIVHDYAQNALVPILPPPIWYEYTQRHQIPGVEYTASDDARTKETAIKCAEVLNDYIKRQRHGAVHVELRFDKTIPLLSDEVEDPWGLSDTSTPTPTIDIPLNGRLDYYAVGNNTKPTIYDIKTTGDLSYAKSTNALYEDPAANIYTYLVGKDCRLVWFYIETKAPHKFHPVIVDLPYAAAKTRIETVFAPYLRRIHEAFTRFDKDAPLQKNTSACFRYGGCDFDKNSKCETYDDPKNLPHNNPPLHGNRLLRLL
jgi:hypothetical protein